MTESKTPKIKLEEVNQEENSIVSIGNSGELGDAATMQLMIELRPDDPEVLKLRLENYPYDPDTVEKASYQDLANKWIENDTKALIEYFEWDKDSPNAKFISKLMTDLGNNTSIDMDPSEDKRDSDELRKHRAIYQDAIYRAGDYLRSTESRSNTGKEFTALIEKFVQKDTTDLDQKQWTVEYPLNRNDPAMIDINQSSSRLSVLMKRLGEHFDVSEDGINKTFIIQPDETIQDYDQRLTDLLAQKGSNASSLAIMARTTATFAHFEWEFGKKRTESYRKEHAMESKQFMFGTFTELESNAVHSIGVEKANDNIMKDFAFTIAGLTFDERTSSTENA